MTNRKAIKGELNKVRDEDIQKIADVKIEDRKSASPPPEENRYQKILEQRKQAKREREEKKLAKPHIGNKKHIVKRSIVEANEMLDESEEEK